MEKKCCILIYKIFHALKRSEHIEQLFGTYGWSWNFIFIPDGETKTLACYSDEQRWKFWNLDFYKKLANYLENR